MIGAHRKIAGLDLGSPKGDPFSNVPTMITYPSLITSFSFR